LDLGVEGFRRIYGVDKWVATEMLELCEDDQFLWKVWVDLYGKYFNNLNSLTESCKVDRNSIENLFKLNSIAVDVDVFTSLCDLYGIFDDSTSWKQEKIEVKRFLADKCDICKLPHEIRKEIKMKVLSNFDERKCQECEGFELDPSSDKNEAGSMDKNEDTSGDTEHSAVDNLCKLSDASRLNYLQANDFNNATIAFIGKMCTETKITLRQARDIILQIEKRLTVEQETICEIDKDVRSLFLKDSGNINKFCGLSEDTIFDFFDDYNRYKNLNLRPEYPCRLEESQRNILFTNFHNFSDEDNSELSRICANSSHSVFSLNSSLTDFDFICSIKQSNRPLFIETFFDLSEKLRDQLNKFCDRQPSSIMESAEKILENEEFEKIHPKQFCQSDVGRRGSDTFKSDGLEDERIEERRKLCDLNRNFDSPLERFVFTFSIAEKFRSRRVCNSKAAFELFGYKGSRVVSNLCQNPDRVNVDDILY
jgi:hypothetical protein